MCSPVSCDMAVNAYPCIQLAVEARMVPNCTSKQVDRKMSKRYELDSARPKAVARMQLIRPVLPQCKDRFG